MTLKIDTTTEFGKRVQHKLETEIIIWLTTVDGDGRPFPSPVWFLYEGADSVLIYSQRNKLKLKNIDANANVAVNFDSEHDGDKVVVFRGAAVIDESTRPAAEHDVYLAKYHERILALGMTDASFSSEFSVPIRVFLQKVRGF